MNRSNQKICNFRALIFSILGRPLIVLLLGQYAACSQTTIQLNGRTHTMHAYPFLDIKADRINGRDKCDPAAGDWGHCVNASAAAEVEVLSGGGVSTVLLTPKANQIVEFGVGTYVTPGIIVPDNYGMTETVFSSKLRGKGELRSILLLAPGSNHDLLTNAHFNALSNTGSGNGTSRKGAFRLELEDLSFDANKDQQTGTSWASRIYGAGLFYSNVLFANGRTGNRYTEYPRPKGDAASYKEEYVSSMYHVTESRSGGTGISYNGPGDLMELDGTTYGNAKWGFEGSQGIHMEHFESYENGTWSGVLKEDGITRDHEADVGGACHVKGADSNITGHGVFCDSENGYGLLQEAPGSPLRLTDSDFSAPKGLQLSNPGNLITGVISQTTIFGVKFCGGSGNLNLVGYSNSGVWFDLMASPECQQPEGGISYVTFENEGDEGTLFSGNGPLGKLPLSAGQWVIPQAPKSWIDATARIDPEGKGDINFFQMGNRCFFANGARLCLPLNNDTLVGLHTTQVWKAPQRFEGGAEINGPFTLTGNAPISFTGLTPPAASPGHTADHSIPIIIDGKTWYLLLRATP